MKKLINISLLVVILFQAGGLLFVFQAEQFYVQYRMQEKLSSSSSDFENITLPLSQYQKSIVGRNEIVVAGKRYDVKSISIIDEMVTITAIHDTEEENAISLIGKTLNSDKEKIPNCFLKLMSLIYVSSSVDDNYSSTEDKLPVSIFIANGILSPQMEILSPPPQA